MVIKKDVIDVGAVPDIKRFKRKISNNLVSSLSDLLKCTVTLEYFPQETFLRQYDIDIRALPDRTTYEIDGNIIMAVHGLLANGVCVMLGIVLTQPQLPFPPGNFLHHVATTIGVRLGFALKQKFRVDYYFFGNDLIQACVVEHLSQGHFSRIKVNFLFELFKGLRSLTFEDRVFNTGLIITRSHYAYKDQERCGTMYTLKTRRQLDPALRGDHRFWNLVDGSTCFYVCDKDLMVTNVFCLNLDSGESVSSLVLKRTLKGRDIAFRTVAKNHFVAVNAAGEEFLFDGTQWHFRYFKHITDSLHDLLPKFSEDQVTSFVELLLSLLKARLSSILWIPETREDIDQYSGKPVQFLRKHIDIVEPMHRGLITRLACSDGALVMSQNGNVLGFGAIADLSNERRERFNEATGTGKLAAQTLSRSGTAIKVSQDGTAKVCHHGAVCWTL